MLKKLSFIIVTAALVVTSGVALAAGPFTRDATDYDGTIPRDCPVFEENPDGSLHVSCTSSVERSDHARIRYRFTKEYGFKRGPATVSAKYDILSGPDDCVRVRWMGTHPTNPTRTLRISVVNTRPQCEAVIFSVTASQP